MIKDLVIRNRSYRRFDETVKISTETLKDLVDLARLSPSARNLQPLKYFISNDAKKNEIIFNHIAWAGYLKDWDGPVKGERPTAYIIILNDKNLTETAKWDDGIVAQSMMLGAVEKGYGGCIIGSIRKNELKEALKLPEWTDIILVLALGKPIEKVVIDEINDNDIKYWRDDNQIHHVPKRNLNDLIIN